MLDRRDHEIASELTGGDYRVEEQIGFILRKVHQRASAIFESVMTDFDITPVQFTLLVKLADEDEASQNRLGRLAAMDPATTFGVIARLKKRGLVQQRKDADDARRIVLSLTEKGRKKVSAMRLVAKNVSIQTLEPLEPSEQELLLTLLAKLT
ncbi:MAG: MarR family winged helix-turn-helix transcriptional regulator [Fimbriimonadaceae bacterium]|nr:MarR family winged helix-turn-helix transcriptional regulator [Alphaproteobacteria bacterium]